MSNLNLKPYELSLWKDELAYYIPEENPNSLHNIYKGLDTDEEDLSFWYLPRNWNDGSFKSIKDEKGKVKIEIKPRSQRKQGLVHLDFSTSSLMFEPNKYYTFLLELDFDDTDKKPDWRPYQKANPTVERHYFISLVRQDVPNSMWHMPKPIFNSSLALMYGKQGFGMDGSSFINEYEQGALFVDNEGVVNGQPEANRLRFIGCLKTNDFIKEQSTLGMWSFIESWIGDYWTGNLRISVFEDNIIDEAPEIYSGLYSLFSGNTQPPSTNKTTRQLLADNLKKALNEEVISSYSKGYIVKTTITESIQNYYNDLQRYVREVYDKKIQDGNTSQLSEILMRDNYFQENYKTINGKLPKKLLELSNNAAKLFYTYFPCLTFPYINSSGGIEYYKDKTHFCSNEPMIPGRTNRQDASVSFFNDIGDIMGNNYGNFSLLDSNILIEPQLDSDNVYIQFGNERSDFIGSGDAENTTYNTKIQEKVNEYWDKFLSGEDNKLYNYFLQVYDSSEGSIFYDFYTGDTDGLSNISNSEHYNQKLTRQMNQAIEFLYRCGITLLLSPTNYRLFTDLLERTGTNLTSITEREVGSTKNAAYYSAIISTIGSYFMDIGETYVKNAFFNIFRNEYGNYSIIILPIFKKVENELEIKYAKKTISSGSNPGWTFRKTLDEIAVKGDNFVSNLITFFSQLAPISLKGKDPTISSKLNPIEYLRERKYCVFGALDGPKSYAQDITFKSNTTGDIHTITFSLYDNYYMPFSGEKEKNPFIPLLNNEDKIKLKYEDKWYDFIITDTELDSTEHKINYTAKDRFVIELSKEGFNKTFNTELDNNVGTIDELAEKVLEGTEWEVGKSDKFYQSVKKAIFGGQLKNGITIKIINYYYDKDLKKIEGATPIEIGEGSYIYMFYDESATGSEKPKIICVDWKNSDTIIPIKNDYEKIEDVLINVNVCPNYEVYNNGTLVKTLTFKEYNVAFPNISSSFLKIKTLDIFNDGENDRLDFDYGARANDIVIKPIVHYSKPLKRYVTQYEDSEHNQLYGYVNNKYTTKPLVQNFLPNGQDFTSLDGWVNGAVNNIHNIKMGLNAATIGSDMSTITPYINFSTSVESGSNRLPHGFVCNTELGYNFATVDHLTPGDEFVLRVQLERGKGLKNITAANGKIDNFDDQLTLMETMRPYLYMYDGSFTLQSKNDLSILPKAEQQVMTFIQNQRYKNQAAIEAKLTNKKEVNDGQGVFSWIRNLNQRISEEGLVSVHWANTNVTLTQNKTATNYNNIPFAYITKSCAVGWENKKYIKKAQDCATIQEYSGYNNKYFLLPEGYKELRKLFRGNNESEFNLKDFSIIANLNQSYFSRDLINSYNFFPDTTTQMYYYLPMLFTDQEIADGLGNSFNVNDTTKKFFQQPNWQEVLKKKEYYELNSTGRADGELRAYPHLPDNSEYQIEFDPNNTIGDCIAYLGNGDYKDFDLLMRMRNNWRVVRYSEEGTCIFETDGIFFGKPLQNGTDYSFTTVSQSEPIGYSYQDLLSQHLGLFFTFDQTVYDDGAKGDTSMALSKVELFRKYKDEDGDILLPDNLIEANTTPIYHFYNPLKNKAATKEADIQYEYTGVTIPENYTICMDETGERRNSITITESNHYNILQKLAEIFNGWLEIGVEHESNGALKLKEDTYRPIKKVRFINTNYNDNYSGIKYGINLKKIGRKIDSNDIITKMIVKNNSNEYGKDGFCSIARSPLNLNGTNSILKLNYYFQIGALTQEILEELYNKIYPRTYVYGQFLAKTISERAEELIIQSQKQAYKEYYQLVLDNAKAKLSEQLDQYSSFGNIASSLPIGFYISNPAELNKLSSALLKNIINSVIFYTGLINGFTQKLVNSINEYEDSVRKYNVLTDLIDGVTQQRDYLLNNFYSLCRGYIKEGSWSSEDYIDDDLYYLDAERQADENSVPKVSYTIDVIDISSLPGFENYKFQLRDKTTMEDPEVFGYDSDGTPIKEEIIITEKTEYLQSPDKNTITVQNYKTKFADLFQRIMSTIQAVEFGTLNYSNKKTSNNYDIKINNNTASLQALKQYNGI